MRARARAFAAAVAFSTALVSCGDSSPARPEPAFADVEFVYTSTLTVGDRDPAEAGVCAHHALGSSRLELWRRGVTLHETLSIRPSGDPPRAAVRAQGLPVDTGLVAVGWDGQCCSHTGSCWPTEKLVANGTRLSAVVRLTIEGDRRGLAFRLRSDGGIVQ